MTLTKGDYTYGDLFEGFQQVGLGPGDTVFVHVCLDRLGRFQDTSPHQVNAKLLTALQEVVGQAGTILVPTYTFSFCRQELFDVQQTPTMGGPWSTSADFLEYFRGLPDVSRSNDPIHSVAGWGAKAADLLDDLPHTCFGVDSVQHRLRQIGGKICTIGVGLHEATLLHHAEEIAKVPFRYQKLFTGYVRDKGVVHKEGWLYYVRLPILNTVPHDQRMTQRALTTGICRMRDIGLGQIYCVEAPALFDLAITELARDPWFTVNGPAAGDPIKLEQARVDEPQLAVELPPNATMTQMIETLWSLPRDIVSEGYDVALKALANQLPMTVHEYPTGTECWSWLVPEKWTCHEAYLETLDGQRLLSYADNPLHVVSYSLAFEGEVPRETLFDHLHVHPNIPEAIPFIFKYYERDWGLCCSQKLKASLTDERYRVVIKTDFTYGTLKVGEVIAPGASDETIILCAHLCHPAMVNDDLSGIVVGIEVMRALLQRSDLRYTYRFLIIPETIGSVAYLSHHEDLIPKMKGGLFLEMLGLKNPHALQLSFTGKTEVDQCFTMALNKYDPGGWTAGFRTIIGNDERQFNGPGVRVPMLALLRILPPSVPDNPYLEYHSSYDNLDITSLDCLEESYRLVLRMIETLEDNVTPINTFKGEVFCSRYGLYIDPYTNPEGNRALFDIMFLIDGSRSIAQIAKECNISFEAARATVDELYHHGLVDYK